MLFLVLMSLASAGCLDNLKEELISCEKEVGECRYEILQGSKYSKLHLEINYVSGFEPSSGALDLLRQRINEVTDKESVTISQNSFGSTDTSYTIEEILEIESLQRKKFKSDNEFVIHILYLNGEFEDNENTLGLAYKGSSFAMFKENIEDSAFLFISAEDIEKAVLVHEYGHLLGLVNMGYTSPHDHEDPEHPHHSNNDESVMYWAVESQDFYNQLDGEPPNNFDSYDLDDLSLMRQGKL
tara:strand:+ start:30 stop:752 length:723 start_codon:yes stop_codon:yes gene_type:complete